MIKRLLHKIWRRCTPRPEDEVAAYVRNGRRPWSPGYVLFKDQFIAHSLADPELLERFRTGQPLPAGYGEFLDERVVEYPWLLARLASARAGSVSDGPNEAVAHAAGSDGRILDGGSILNYPHIVAHPVLAHANLTIVTLAPEGHCFWQRGVNYVFADLRDLPFRDNYFDQVVSVSTLEHVDKDNAMIYTSDEKFKENKGLDFTAAVQELKRVCKPGGKVYVTVPFGRFTDFGWFQQFDAPLLDRLIAAFAPAQVRQTFFRYADGGWQFCTREDCAPCEAFNIHATRYMDPSSTLDYDPDYAAASRGIAALELWKERTA